MSAGTLSVGISSTASQLRVAWLFPTILRTHYWQPVFREFATLVPQSSMFIGRWGGFAPGYEGTFNLRVTSGVKPVVLKNNRGGEHYDSGFFWAPPSIVKDLAQFRPHVIFTTGFGNWTICALLYKAISRAKVVVLWDGCSVDEEKRISTLRYLQRRAIAPFIDFVVSNMREGVAYMQHSLGMPEQKLLAHPYQVADAAILDSSNGAYDFRTKRRPIFLYVGSIDARKGWRYLLEATRKLVQRGLDGFSVVFVGAGREEEELKTRISDGLASVAYYAGPIPYHQMASAYRDSDVFVFPTLDDVWGLVLVEAMTFGKPVICSQYAGAREMVVPGKNGFIVDPRDPGSLANSMARFISDPALIAGFGANSRDLAAPFTPRRSAQVLAGVALDVHRGRRANLESQSRALDTSCS